MGKRVVAATAAAATAAVVSFLAGPAVAGPRLLTGVGFGPSVPTSGRITDSDFTIDFDRAFDTGSSIAGWAVLPVNGVVGVRGEIGRDRMSTADSYRPVEADLDHLRFLLGLQVGRFERRGRGAPYGFGAIGAFRSRFVAGDVASERTTDFGIGFGVGYDGWLGQRWSLGGEVAVHAVFPGQDLSSRWWLVPRMVVGWRW